MALGNRSYSKTKELMLYVAGKLSKEESYGSVLLNKALYFIDNISYLRTGAPVSRFSYVKQELGPTPEPAQFLSLKAELETAGDIEMVRSDYWGRVQKKMIAKRSAKLDDFKATEIDLIDEVLANIGRFNATQISDISHKFPAWQVAQDKEKLPLFTYLISSKAPTDEDIKWAQSKLNGIQDSEE